MITALALLAVSIQEPIYAGVDLRARNMPIRQALGQLGRQMGGDTFEVPSTIKGNVNAVFINLPYRSAVSRVLAQVGAGCRSVVGIRVIGANNRPVPHKVFELGRIETPVTLQGEMDIRTALRGLFKQVDRSYVVDSDVQGRIQAGQVQEPFSTVLSKILSQAGAAYAMDGDVFAISSAVSRLSPQAMAKPLSFSAVKERRWQTLSRLARASGIALELDPSVDVDSRVTVEVASAPLELVLKDVVGPKTAVSLTDGICRLAPVVK